jgi:hypothetical protein
MFNVFPQTGLPGFRVRPEDDVPGFDIDENGLPRRERPWSDARRPGSATPQYPDLAQAMMPTPSLADSVQPAPPQPPDWLYNLLTMPLPALPSSFIPLSGGRPVPYGKPINPVMSYPTPDQNAREMGNPRTDVARIAPWPIPSAVEGQWLSFDAPKPLVDIDAHPGAAAAQNAYSQPAGQEAMGDARPQPLRDGQPYAQAGVAGPQGLSGAEVTLQPTGAPPALSVGSAADPNFVLANAGGDDVQEAQQTQQPGRNIPPPVPQKPPAQAKPSASKQQPSPLRREKSGEELTQLTERRREEALSQDALKENLYKAGREERQPYWDYMLRQLPVPALPGSGIQEPLPLDWRAAVRKIDPRYLDYTEAAAKKYGLPPEVLARLLYRESNYENKGVDSNGNRLRNRAAGIPQMYPDALKDVGVDPETFGRAGAAAQIDAGAAYLARQYRRFGDWPRAVAAYHFGANRIEAWLAGRGITYDNIKRRTEGESASFPGAKLKDREKAAEKGARREFGQWWELQGYLPYIFLGDPSRYDRPRGP